jgi:hypothetical protein
MSIRSHSLLLSIFVVACGDGATMGSDASTWRDSALGDGGGLLDSGAGSLDAGAAPSDAGPSAYCQYEACDPRYPDGCGEGSCVLWAASSTCEATPGSLSTGMVCETVMDCAPGLSCFLTAEGGVCGRICCPGDPSACIDWALCAGSGVLVDGTRTSWGRCAPPRTCDVLSPQGACEEREGCYIVDEDGTTQCRVAGIGGPGDACAVQEDCQSGFFCGFTGRCVRICRLGADDCPSDEGHCVAQAHSPAGTGFCTLDPASAR